MMTMSETTRGENVWSCSRDVNINSHISAQQTIFFFLNSVLTYKDKLNSLSVMNWSCSWGRISLLQFTLENIQRDFFFAEFHIL